ncbi:enoyl-CoA hydratase-related protein [Pseudomonas sp. OVF7]|uniref:enoyl-CoA hydratase/isomerase family protein n=1 Tax=Pseudomonas sp. OVF7 TaxID=1382237 RepID=UPI002729B9D9|nr:enoyl-CoA hydratase-related protein [Pseudomonas sp. OVF7]WLD65468.1 enoyl-CoA hydratase-related protein [Pseudomonas sp. OVF7]
MHDAVGLDVIFEQHQGIAFITLNRPETRNALSESALQQLLQAFSRCVESPDLHAVILRGKGPLFCAGGDVTFFRQLLERLPEARRDPLANYIGLAHQAILTLAQIPVPVIAAVQGGAAGIGMSLSCMADFIVAEQGCKFIPAYLALGTTPDGGLSRFLPAIIGEKRALDVLMFNRSIDMAQAHQWGLVSHVVQPGELERSATELAKRLAAGPYAANRQLKQLVKGVSLAQLADHLDQELQSFIACAATEDFAAGVMAFIEKRPPVFGQAKATALDIRADLKALNGLNS